MKKTAALAAMYFAILLTFSPIAIAVSSNQASTSPSSDWNYIPLSIGYVVNSTGTSPDGLPLCKNSRLGNIVCYSPAFVKKAYNFPPTSTLNGAGQTIVIVDAFGSPTIASDLSLFDAVFRLPAPASFTIFCGNSPTPFDSSTCPMKPLFTINDKHDVQGWAIETSLDVEYAHAMAPGANIVLDVAATSSGNAINDAEAAAIAAFPGAIFSQSFGIPEIFIKSFANNAQVMQAQENYAAGVALGDTFFASAGDTGADFGTGVVMANFPGSDLHNTAVTGTQGNPYNATGTLVACPTSTPFSCTSGLSAFHGPCVLGRTAPPSCVPDGYRGEQVWNEPSFGVATGGAPSLLFGVPSYQSGLGLSARGPDVSYNAAIDGGVLVVSSILGFPALFIVGGTSAGSPQWAGIAALANQARALAGKGPIGDLNPVIYSIFRSASYATDFHDITVGNDQLFGTNPGYSAGAGYDLASGIGSPNVANLITDLTAAP
ncbi:MAG: S53 family peptidase [Nitrososphaerales archaeon]|nr:S53 family peptidase [Nitrososphaerales archaeon]